MLKQAPSGGVGKHLQLRASKCALRIFALPRGVEGDTRSRGRGAPPWRETAQQAG
jgi:hypothetical protein